MDADNALEAVLVIRGTVPEAERAVFDEQLAIQLGLVGAVAGSVAMEGAMQEDADTAAVADAETAETPETELEKQLPDFLNPNIQLGASDQLATMREFWQTLGYEVPKLDAVLQARLERVIAEHPDRRVVPSPLLGLASRIGVAFGARAHFGKNEFNPDATPLWTPDTNWTYGKLLADPGSTVKDGRNSYGLRYRTPTGEVVTRTEYSDALLADGHAVLAEDGTPWVFPVMDVQVRAPRTRDTAGNLHKRVGAMSTPESLITMQLLHQANGTPNPNWEVDFANEAVYELDRKGNPVAPVDVAGVVWDPGYRRVYLDYWDADDQDDRFGVRAEESGLRV